jgi:hypothetical protein
MKDLPPGLNMFNDECLRQHQENSVAKNVEHVRAVCSLVPRNVAVSTPPFCSTVVR